MIIAEEKLKECRHPKRKIIFSLITIPFIVMVLGLFVITFFRKPVIDLLKNEVIEEWFAFEQITNMEVSKLPSDKKDELYKKYIISNKDGNYSWIADIFNDYWYPYMILLFLIAIFLLITFQIYKLYTEAKTQGIRIDEYQFPKAYNLFKSMSDELGFKKTPELYLKNGHWAYNAFAACVPWYRNFAVIYDQIFIAYENGWDENVFRFVVWHELGHIKLGHVTRWNIIIKILANLPFVNYFLGLPMSRIQEYEADKVGALLAPTETWSSLAMLIWWKDLYKKINIEEYCKQNDNHTDFSSIFANLLVDHPIIPRRIQAIRDKIHWGVFLPIKKR